MARGEVSRGANPLEPRRGRGKRSEASERVSSAGGDPTTLLNRFAEELRRAPKAGPDEVGVNAAKQAREFHPPEAINDWARGGS